MIILVLVALVAFNMWLFRTHAPGAFRWSSVSDAKPRRQNPACACETMDHKSTDASAESRGWTALDDHQLNRLLKESSP